MNKQEEWKNISEHIDYQVSNFGNIKHIKKKLPRVLAIGTWGYPQVSLYIKGKMKTYKIHKLVAKYFIPNPNNYRDVNHIDGNKLNNKISNLEWCTHKDNAIHASKIGINHHKILNSELGNIRSSYLNGESQTSIAKRYNVDQSSISLIVTNKRRNYV